MTDAEEQATGHRDGAKAWLHQLKTVAYEANEVFDEFKYEALRREARKKGHYSELRFHVIKLFPTHNRIVFRYKMSHKLCRILKAIDALIVEMHAFRFKYRPQSPVSKQWRQTDYAIIDQQEIASRSRQEDKKNIIATLLCQANNSDLTVVPIVGMGGLGKTTLAQLVYNEPEIREHFPLLLWVCVSDTFDVNSLAKSVVEAAPRKSEDKDEDTKKPPLDRLRKLVSGHRYLLVLDDVWNREVHKWEKLKVCLQDGGMGSAVLTTTRDKRVAEIMGADSAYNLNALEDCFLKEIIEAKAFSLEKGKPADLGKMVDEIVKRCSGSPLAATALGSLLRTKSSMKEWKAISSRSSICTEETGILPILKLSYNDLPPHMKQCFAFCAVFPKDYKIDVEKLIQLWIANGFIPEHKEDSLETTGKRIFDELASRSFFLDKEKSKDESECYNITTCIIHDLMHDIACSVMEKECVVATMEPSQNKLLPDTTRHLFFSCEETKSILNDSMEKRSLAIQTLICDSFVRSPLQHVPKYKSLHALKLCIEKKSFLLNPKYLHHLRYLDLSYSSIKALPEDISILYNLQTLDLSNCFDLAQLPRQMKYMTSLRHLYTHGCPKLESMPPELGKLTNLQTLTCFVAADTRLDCSDVAELQDLNLGGQLELCQLEKIGIEGEAKLTNIGQKKDLTELTLRWTYFYDSKVLDNFKPHDGLQVLRIYYYGGKCMGMLQNMVQIHLFHCRRPQFLFRLGTSFTFPKLKQLTLEGLFAFERWWSVNERQDEQIIFPLLEKLVISNCEKFVELLESQQVQGARGGHCSLVFPALKVLKLVGLKSFQRLGAVGGTLGEQLLFPCLEELSIWGCPKLVALPEAPLLQEPCGGGYRLVRSPFPALKVLDLRNLASFQRWYAVEETRGQMLFPQLEKLSIKYCPELIALSEAPLFEEPFHGGNTLVCTPFSLLENLFIMYRGKLVALLEPPLVQEPWNGDYRLVHSSFPSLKVLELKHLDSFQRWGAAPEGEEILFPQLEKLSVQKCPKIIDLPKAPKLSVLEIEDGKQELFNPVVRYLSSLTNLTLKLEYMETTSEVECSSIVPVGIKEESPLKVMGLWCCNSFFGEGALEHWGYFVHLEDLEIERCDVLVHWPEKEFKILVSLRRLVIINCKNLIGYAEAPLEPSAAERSQHLLSLEVVVLQQCASLVEMFNIPASLKEMVFHECCKLESIFGRKQGRSELVQGSSCSEKGMSEIAEESSCTEQGVSEIVEESSCSEAIVHMDVSELPSSAMSNFCPCLEHLSLSRCESLPAVLNLPSSLKTIYIRSCSSIQDLRCEPKKPEGMSMFTSNSDSSAYVRRPSAAAREHSLPPSLQSLEIRWCGDMLGGILRLPMSLKELSICDNSGLTSLEFVSAVHPPLLESLDLRSCSALASLPNEPQVYSSLWCLQITGCPAIKKLPTCLHQQLGRIYRKDLDARYEVLPFKPKTWKEIPRILRNKWEDMRG